MPLRFGMVEMNLVDGLWEWEGDDAPQYTTEEYEALRGIALSIKEFMMTRGSLRSQSETQVWKDLIDFVQHEDLDEY